MTTQWDGLFSFPGRQRLATSCLAPGGGGGVGGGDGGGGGGGAAWWWWCVDEEKATCESLWIKASAK